MRIKKIELIGFKSFKDRTVIQFDAGITGVVGPNGCGKSNIVDALLWVMGEMSAKDLRGSSMVDVIFAGSEGYAPSGMAEVSLTLENDGGPFPVKFQKFSEVMVTRRLYRNGESEYAINKETARLRDIQEIFMDTGAGSKGFSIIQQGMIGKIITSKPEDRRMLIEEAAGITKFKARKKESQRKLQTTDQNLLRLADIVGELKRQMDSLKRQAERAERYRILKGQIEELDISLASRNYDQINQEVVAAQTRLFELQAQETVSEVEIAEMTSKIESLKLEMLELEKLLDDKNQKVGANQLQVQKLELEIQKLEFEIEQAKTKGEMTGSLMQIQQLRRETLVKESEELSLQKNELNLQVHELKLAHEEKKSIFLEQEARDQELDEELTLARRELFAVGQTESQVDAKISSLESQIEDIENRLSEAVAVQSELKVKEQEYFLRFEEQKEKVTQGQASLDLIQNQILNLEVSKKEWHQKIAAAQIENDEFKNQLGLVSSKLAGLEDLSRNFEGYEEGVKQVILWQKNRAEMTTDPQGLTSFTTLSEVVEVPAEYEVALGAVLGHRLQLLLSENSENAMNAVDYLKQNKKGRASFALADYSMSSFGSEDHGGKTGGGIEGGPAEKSHLVGGSGQVIALLSSVVQAPSHLKNTIDLLTKKIAVVETISGSLELKKVYPDWTFVTLDGDVLSDEGVLTAGYSEGSDSSLLKRKREIKELELLKEQWAGKAALSLAYLKKLDEEFVLTVENIELLKDQKTQIEKQFLELKKDLDRSEIELRNIRHSIERSDKECARYQEQLVSVQIKNNELAEARTEILEKKQSLTKKSYELETELENLRLGFSGLREEVTQLQLQLTQNQTLAQSVEQNYNRVSQDLNKIETELSKINQESAQAGATLSHHFVLLENKKLDFNKAVRSLEELRNELSHVNSRYEEMSQSLQDEEATYHFVQTKANQRLHQVNEAQIKFEQLKMKEQVLIEQIKERYQVLIHDTYKNHLGDQRPSELIDQELKEAKEKLIKIGEVNLSAIEEYKQTSERYEFLTHQQNDLIEAKDQLRKVIDRINRICSKRFKDTFDLVNERFTKVFPVLFGGGEARLELIEDSEKGEMGIDIIAKPPGKKMQNISLLSGGEKALTAVSLVFAIFLVKPSPYCLLDEVDAPLDDANVSRFNDLVREMAKRSQIIVVTHNKHTMEIAEKLYGVTMQERGVSTMVSVNLAELS